MPRSIVSQMARVLAESEIDLRSFPHVLLALIEARFTSTEIIDHVDDAIEVARARRVTRPISELLRRIA